jgi:hypothetical protein
VGHGTKNRFPQRHKVAKSEVKLSLITTGKQLRAQIFPSRRRMAAAPESKGDNSF